MKRYSTPRIYGANWARHLWIPLLPIVFWPFIILGATIPAKSEAQRRLFAVAEHAPDKLYPRNRGLAKLGKRTLSEFASTPERTLPKYVSGKSSPKR